MTETVDLYRIVMGFSVWTFTNDAEQVYNAGEGDETYVKLASSRGTIEQKNEISKAALEINIPIDHPLALVLLTAFVEQVVSVSVFTKRGSTVEISWKGRLVSIKPADANLTLNFESVFTSMKRPGLRARFQRSCRHSLYSRGCNVDLATFAVSGTLSAMTGAALTVAEAALQADGYFSGGMVEASDGTLSYIISHTGDQLILQRVGYTLQTDFAVFGASTPVTIYPGCDHTRATCAAKFDNILNYGGFDWIPTKNPMAGSSIV